MDTSPVDPSKMQTIYPHYINSKKARVGGRRIAASKGVPDPTCEEIFQACKSLGLMCENEPEHCYPRDHLFEVDKGRVRVLLKADGKPVLEQLPNKYTLYVALSKAIKTARANKGAGKKGNGKTKAKGKGGKKGKH